jgi:hypothetical protein
MKFIGKVKLIGKINFGCQRHPYRIVVCCKGAFLSKNYALIYYCE